MLTLQIVAMTQKMKNLSHKKYPKLPLLDKRRVTTNIIDNRTYHLCHEYSTEYSF